MENNTVSFYKKPRNPVFPRKEKEYLSSEITNIMKEAKTADVYTFRHTIVPAKSYFFLPVHVNELKQKQKSAFLYVTLLEAIRDKYGLEHLTVKMPRDESTILVINATAKDISLPANTPIAYTENQMEEISLSNSEVHSDSGKMDDVYKYRSRKEIEDRSRATEINLTYLFSISIPIYLLKIKEKYQNYCTVIVMYLVIL